jgi:hypothetical protein
MVQQQAIRLVAQPQEGTVEASSLTQRPGPPPLPRWVLGKVKMWSR